MITAYRLRVCLGDLSDEGQDLVCVFGRFER